MEAGPAPGQTAGVRIGPYELLGEVGRGGAGVVHRARTAGGEEVALKLLLRGGAGPLGRFERERRLLAELGEAQGFVPLLDAGQSPQGPYLVMPFLGGGTLRQRLRAGPLRVDQALALGRRLAAALGRAHRRGVVHRDLKPENILFTSAGVALVSDLGLAKHFDPAAPGASQSVALSRTSEVRGTVGYMPPEQGLSAKEVQPTADVFALGAILYECLAGRPAFVGATALELIDRVAEGRVAPLNGLRPETPAWLAAAIHEALAPAPGDRPRDGDALARRLAGPARRRTLPAGKAAL